MKQLYLLSLFILCFIPGMRAQEVCGYDLVLEQIKKDNPGYEQKRDEWYRKAQHDFYSSKRDIIKFDTVYQIPVVFHVVYQNAAENISSVYINSQMTALNECFRRTNSDTINTRSIFRARSKDTRIQFVLATKDPQGNPTTGITRTATTVTEWGNINNLNNNMKFTSQGGEDGWDPTRYLNIWICDLKDPNFGEVLYGFAYPPDGAPNWQNSTVAVSSPYSGVVLHYKIVGQNNPQAAPAYKQGKTGVHEVGHYLGLRHIWGDGQAPNQCNVDDGIKDTPNAAEANAGCPTNRNTCVDPGTDDPDMVENYMDYTSNTCQNAFTAGQAAILQYVLKKFRYDLPELLIDADTIPGFFDKSEMLFFPNPVTDNSDYLKVDIHHTSDELFDIELYDMLGRLIYKKEVKPNTGAHEIVVSNIAAGAFVVRAVSKSGSVDIRKKALKTAGL